MITFGKNSIADPQEQVHPLSNEKSNADKGHISHKVLSGYTSSNLQNWKHVYLQSQITRYDILKISIHEGSRVNL